MMPCSIERIRDLADLRAIFPEPVADERNFCLFSTSGVHGSYATLEDIEADPEIDEVTVLVVHPRIVSLRYGNVAVTAESLPYLKALRDSSRAVVQRIGYPDPAAMTAEIRTLRLALAKALSRLESAEHELGAPPHTERDCPVCVDPHAPRDGWAAQPAKMHRRVRGDSTQRAYEAREHMQDLIGKPDGEK